MPPITLQLVSGLRQSPARAVGFLSGDDELALVVFNSLPQKDRDWIMTGMGLWIDKTPADRRHHGFGGIYSDCHVFKCVYKKHRFYGFKCHPQKGNKSFELCVVTTYTFKPDVMDYGDLDRVQMWRDTPATKKAIDFVFLDTQKGKKQ